MSEHLNVLQEVVLDIRASDFVFVSYFDIRIS